MTRRDQPLLCLMGPTASGKTGVALELARRFPVRIISVDSAQVYRGMDIGTAKPSPDVLDSVPHGLVDICDPVEAYSAARFCEDVPGEVRKARDAGRIPLLVGGTMLYFRALEHGLADLPAADASLRAQMEREAAERGWDALHRELATIDPESARRIHPNDAQRIQRALEIYRLSGSTMTALLADVRRPEPGGALMKCVLAPARREVLNARIADRFDAMLDNGFVPEVEALRARGDLGLNHPSMRAVGYRQVWHYLDGAFDRLQLRENGVVATRQFAKRQMTWLRKETDALWMDPDRDAVVDRLTHLIESVS
ncbi:tRNA (adenosine(37)-N6)-dimethylallyltransferase MiaA [Aquisalimonas sp.]|uniref:tRNA (adenosine(37)-N6)-dimethylallyltransferase MiaA n=1 Tax=unclassified Aquisalimonas TaxID=2644645 RepID=UPI0025B7FD7D|nr:tRNA (adenosine(37)-N6)-dimethylallyltransferase MiaA [Aquisalimonas sp.]